MNWHWLLLPAVLAVAGAGWFGWRAFAGLRERHASLERLYELSDALAAAPGSADVVRSVLRQSVHLLSARYAEIVIGGTGAPTQLWALRRGGDVQGPVEAGAHQLTLRFPPGGRRYVKGETAAEREFLRARRIGAAILVPLRIDGPVAGHLLVADPVDPDAVLTGPDLRLLETVANHAGLALRNGRLIERLRYEARHDELTGLPNRLHFRGLLDAAAVAARSGLPSAVMLLDFNGFKAINDSLGHPAGDELLRVMADRFRRAIGRDAVVARLGGDEFAVLARGCGGPEAAALLAGRVLSAFDDVVPLAGTRLRVGGALGIALGPEHGTTGADLLRKADVAMYVAKSRSSGAAGWRMYSPDMTITSPADLSLATELRDAIANDEIAVVVQPLVDIETGAVHSFEALARWRHAELGEIHPEEFFAAAERSGQVPALSERVLDRALQAVAAWRDEDLDLRVAVNVAPRWLAETDLPDKVAAALARHGVRPDRLSLELTEDGVIADPQLWGTEGGSDSTREVLSRLQAMGVHLSLDDFGTGYSSLTFLSRLPVDQLKIDRSFVRKLAGSARDRAIVGSIIDLGRGLGMEVVAEGLTDPATRRTLQQMGCRLGQGYLFTPPVPPAEVPMLVHRVGTLGWSVTSRPERIGLDTLRA